MQGVYIVQQMFADNKQRRSAHNSGTGVRTGRLSIRYAIILSIVLVLLAFCFEFVEIVVQYARDESWPAWAQGPGMVLLCQVGGGVCLVVLAVWLCIGWQRVGATQGALEQQQRQFDLILQHSFDGINICKWQFSPGKRRLVMCNDRYVEMSGYTRQELFSCDNIGRLAKQLPGEATRMTEEQLRVPGSVFRGISRWLRPDGKENYYEWVAVSTVIDGDVYVIGVDRDITEKRRIEKALRDSERLHRSMFEDNRAVKLLIDPEAGSIVRANQAACDFYGYTREKIEQMNIAAVNVIDPEQIAQAMQRAAGQQQTEFIFEHKLASGQIRTVEVFSGPVWHDGRVLLFSIIHDITDRQRAEQAVRNSEQRLRMILHATSDSVWDFNLGTGQIYHSRTYLESLGFDQCELLHDDCVLGRIIHPHDKPQVRQAFRLHCEGRTPDFSIEYRIRDPRDRPHWLLTRGRVVEWDQNGTAVRIVGTHDDITARKQAEERLVEEQHKLRELAAQLAEIEQQQRRTIATGLHDRVAQPLVFAKIQLQTLQHQQCGNAAASDCNASNENTSLYARYRELCTVLDKAIDDVRSLTFELSCPALYELGLEAAVSQWLRDTIEPIDGLNVEFSAPETPLALDDAVRFTVYESIRELLVNVVKHADAQSVQVTIEQSGGNVVASVCDDGRGFDESVLGNSNHDRKGFGLFNIRERLQYLGGSLSISSGDTTGTCVTLVAPITVV